MEKQTLLERLSIVPSLPYYSPGLKHFIETNEEKIELMTPIHMYNEIDKVLERIIEFLNKNINKNISYIKFNKIKNDVLTEFGIWSNCFNIILRKKISNFEKSKVEEEYKITVKNMTAQFKYVYAYWWNTYHLIAGYYTKKIRLKTKTIKNVFKGRETLSKLINGEINIDIVSEEFKKTIENINNLNIKEVINIEKENKK